MIQAGSYIFPPLRRDASMVGVNDRFGPEEAAYQSARVSCLLNGEEDYLRRMEKNGPMTLSADPNEDCPELPAEGDGIRCRAGKCSFWVTWDGRLLPCGMLPGAGAENVFESDFVQSWQRVHEWSKSIRLPVQCAGCALRDECKACAAMVLTETGNFSTVPEYRCRMAKAFGPASRQLEREILKKRGNQE